MSRFIYEDDIEQALLDKLAAETFCYDVITCDPSTSSKENINDGTGRTNKKQCVLPAVLRSALIRINPTIPYEVIDGIIKDLCRDFTGGDMKAVNYKLYQQIRNYIKVSVRRNGKQDFDFVKLIDFDNPENNTFTAVSQMWIEGRFNWRRPDVIIFVNGLPLVFVELKNSDVKVEEAYNRNLKSYLKDVPNLFAFNQICVLSNGLETRLGAFSATYDYFFEWLKASEDEKIDRKAISEDGVSLSYFADGLLPKANLIDYIENFILFENQSINANYIAFTGTPLLGSKRLTNQWFGNYVSEYNFAQSVEDGSTVPLFYSRRVPEVWLENDFLDDDVLDIIEDENLNEAETKLLENSSSRILEVIKRDDRLDKIARDIVHHLPRRGFRGKAMVVSVDKYTAVKMYDKVQHYWSEEKKKLVAERNKAASKEERDQISAMIDYMNKVEMAVIVSEEADENQKFAAQGLDISSHRAKMNEITPEGKDIEDRFKDPTDPLQLVFVCAMWLTGFDVKSLSTVYLDKPMKGHTLMQAIARANRVFPTKTCGIIVDYVNVFKYMKKALSDYASGDDDTEFPAKDIDQLIVNIDSCIDETDAFLKEMVIDLDKIIAEASTFDKLDELRAAYNKIIATDDAKDRFKVLANTTINLYEAAKPEIFEQGWTNEKFSPIFYLHGLFYNYIDDEKINRARLRMAQVLDTSVSSNVNVDADSEYVIHGTKVIDLSKIDVDELRLEIKKTPYKAIEIDDLKKYLEEALQKMIMLEKTAG